MARQGFISNNNGGVPDPYVYQENNAGQSASVGINSLTLAYEINMDSVPGAQPGTGFQPLTIDYITGTITLTPLGGAKVLVDGPLEVTANVKIDPLVAGAMVTDNTGNVSSVNDIATYVLTSNGVGLSPSFQPSAGGGTLTLNYTLVTNAMSPYTVLPTDEYISADVTAGVITILLPNSPAIGRMFIVKDQIGQAPAFIITVTTVGGVVTLDGVTTFMMNTAYEVAQFIFNGTNYEVF